MFRYPFFSTDQPSEIMNNDFSGFLDDSSKINLNAESFTDLSPPDQVYTYQQVENVPLQPDQYPVAILE